MVYETKIIGIALLWNKAEAAVFTNGTIKILISEELALEELLMRAEYPSADLYAAMFLRLKEYAARCLGEPVSKAVVTLPMNPDAWQCAAVREGGSMAGLEIVRILSASSAAALACASQQEDWMCLCGPEADSLHICLAGSGDNVADPERSMDLADYSLRELEKRYETYLKHKVLKTGPELLANEEFLKSLVRMGKEGLISLAENPAATICVPYRQGGYEERLCRIVISKEELISPAGLILEGAAIPIRKFLDDAADYIRQVDPPHTNIGRFLFYGDTGYEGILHEIIRSVVENRTVGYPEHAQVYGAAIQGAKLSGAGCEDSLLVDILGADLCILLDDGSEEILLDQDRAIPIRDVWTFQLPAGSCSGLEILLFQHKRDSSSASDRIQVFHKILCNMKMEGNMELTVDVGPDKKIWLRIGFPETGERFEAAIEDRDVIAGNPCKKLPAKGRPRPEAVIHKHKNKK